MYGSTLLNKLILALLSLTNTPLWSCLNLKSLRILVTLGFNLLIPLILITKAILASAGTYKDPESLAYLLNLVS